jgi:hypothetical protein
MLEILLWQDDTVTASLWVADPSPVHVPNDPLAISEVHLTVPRHIVLAQRYRAFHDLATELNLGPLVVRYLYLLGLVPTRPDYKVCFVYIRPLGFAGVSLYDFNSFLLLFHDGVVEVFGISPEAGKSVEQPSLTSEIFLIIPFITVVDCHLYSTIEYSYLISIQNLYS